LTYNITFKESVWRDLKRIDKHQVEIILTKIEAILPEGAESYPTFSGQFSKLRKFRVGNYRVIYTIKDNSVLITRIQHRKDVYRS
jgi:mRNA interferase RelE/StbE